MAIFTFLLLCLINGLLAQSRLFTGQKSLRCTNYGDPHIFPFQGDMQTCALCGTHVLVKNDYIIATATVEYVNMTFSRATFVNKINIAFFDQDGLLISTFGSEDIERNCKSFIGFLGSGDHIRAYISSDSGTAYLYYKQTKINVFIRKNRLGYSFGIYLPESMVSHSNGICVTGCPSDQVLRLETIENPVITARIPSATELCRNRFFDVNSNDPTLEARIRACLFDVAVTGDETLASEHLMEITDETLSSDESNQHRKRSMKARSQGRSRILTPQAIEITDDDDVIPFEPESSDPVKRLEPVPARKLVSEEMINTVVQPETVAQKPLNSRMFVQAHGTRVDSRPQQVDQQPVPKTSPQRRQGKTRVATPSPVTEQQTLVEPKAAAVEDTASAGSPTIETTQPQMTNDASQLCIPIDCSLTNEGGRRRRFAYPGKEHYFFECSPDGIIQTRRCPINNTFDGTQCIAQEF